MFSGFTTKLAQIICKQALKQCIICVFCKFKHQGSPDPLGTASELKCGTLYQILLRTSTSFKKITSKCKLGS